MESRKRKPEITEATEKTTGLMRELQSRVRKGDPRADVLIHQLRDMASEWKPAVQEMPVQAPVEPTEDLESELEAYFARETARSTKGKELRRKVVDRVVEKLLSEWEWPEGGTSSLESEVVDRLVERVIERLHQTYRRA